MAAADFWPRVTSISFFSIQILSKIWLFFCFHGLRKRRLFSHDTCKMNSRHFNLLGDTTVFILYLIIWAVMAGLWQKTVTDRFRSLFFSLAVLSEPNSFSQVTQLCLWWSQPAIWNYLLISLHPDSCERAARSAAAFSHLKTGPAHFRGVKTARSTYWLM